MEANQRFTTSDGADIHYVDSGKGQTIIMIPGWSQTAEMFKEQYRPLSKHFRCIAVDMRGHGESGDVDHGFSVARLADDLHELIVHLGVGKPILLGHSMGASVIWRYFSVNDSNRISKMIFVDQPPVLTAQAGWSAEECEQYGAIFTATAIDETCSALAGAEAKQATRNLLSSMFTENYFAQHAEWVVAENLKLRRTNAVNLLRDHCRQDWREVIKNIDLPCLIIGGRSSLMPWQSQQWLGDTIRDSKLFVFEENEGGQHFMFLENPATFNKIVCNFCQ